MIAYLKGPIMFKEKDHLVLEAGGVGHRVEVSTQTLSSLSMEGDIATLLIHHHFTESDQRLFGFSTLQEKHLFELLITVKGIGPKLGLTILSGMNVASLVEAIHHGQAKTLATIPGIGGKTAERMVLELKDKIFRTDSAATAGASSPSIRSANPARDEAIIALESLGYRRKDAEAAIQTLVTRHPDDDTPALLRKALTLLNT